LIPFIPLPPKLSENRSPLFSPKKFSEAENWLNPGGTATP
jgi:hypothetical protein